MLQVAAVVAETSFRIKVLAGKTQAQPADAVVMHVPT